MQHSFMFYHAVNLGISEYKLQITHNKPNQH